MRALGPMLAEADLAEAYLAALNLRRAPLQNAIIAHSRGGGTPTGGPLEVDYRGNYHAVLPGELPSRGMRRVMNLLNDTADFSSSAWTKLRASISDDAVVETATTGAHGAYQTVTSLPAGKFFGQVKVKAEARGFAYFEMSGSGNTYVNLSTGEISNTTPQLLHAAAELQPDGYWLISGAVQNAVAGNRSLAVYAATAVGTNSYSGTDGLAAIRVKDLMLELVPVTQNVPSKYVSNGVITPEMLGPEIFTGFTTLNGWTDHGDGSYSINNATGSPIYLTIDIGETNQTYLTECLLERISETGSAVLYALNSTAISTTSSVAVSVTRIKNTTLTVRADPNTGVRVSAITVKRLNYHGWGVDGLDKLDTDEYGNDLTIGLGPELVPDPELSDAASWEEQDPPASWEVSGGEISILGNGTEHAVRPAGIVTARVGSIFEVRYSAKVPTSNAVASAARVVLSNATKVSGDHVITGAGAEREMVSYWRSTSTYVRPQLACASGAQWGAVGDSAIFYSVSVREAYPVLAAGAWVNPAVTNLLSRNQNAPDWTARGAATIANAGDGTVSGGYFNLRGLGAQSTDDVYRIVDGGTSGQNNGLAFLVRPVSGSSGSLKVVTSAGGGATGNWTVNLSGIPVDKWSLINRSHPAVSVVSEFTSGTTSTGVWFYAASGTLDVDVAVPTLAAGTLYCSVVIPTATTAVAVAADVLTADLSALGFTEGTIVVSHVPARAPSVDAGNQIVLDAVTDANNRAIVSNSAGNLAALVVDGGATQWSANAAGGKWTAGVRQNIALRLEEDAGRLSSDGAMRLADAAMTVPAMPTLYLGGDASSKYSGGFPALVIFGPGQTDAQVDANATAAAIDALVGA